MILPVEDKIMRDLTNILGIRVDRLDTKGVLKHIDDFIAGGRKCQVSYVNAHCFNYTFSDKEYRNILLASDLVYADGMAVVWSSYLYRNEKPLSERVNLGDFLYSLCNLCVEKEYSLFLLGGREGIAGKAAERLIREYPKLKIAGKHHGFFGINNEQEVIEQINNSGANILLVGMGVPKQEKWIARNKNILQPSVLWGVGALFDYYSGYIKRAPLWMRKAGLEWLFRLFVEPGRLWKRYVIGNLLFSFRILLPVIVDIALVVSAWLLTYRLRFSINRLFAQPIGEFKNYLSMLALIALSWPFICNFAGAYSAKKRLGQIGLLADTFKVVAIGLVIAVIFSFTFREMGIARSFLIIWSLFNFLLFFISRWFLKDKILFRNIPLNVLIVGTSEASFLFSKEIKLFSEHKVTGFLKSPGSNDKEQQRDKNILGEVGELEEIVNRYNIDEVILADENMPLSDKLNLAVKHLNTGINFRIVSEELKPVSEKIKLSNFYNRPVLDISYNESANVYILFKELMDKAIALIGSIMLLPLMCIIALIIKCDTPGPAIFMQTRVGKNGKNFKLYKFRTMFKDSPPNEQAPLKENEQRVTCVGRFLRRWSIDELPQLLNVLKDEMSIVGPRPEMTFIVKDYQTWQRQRLKVKPGITGLWQVAGRKDIPLHQHIEYDFYYINNRSFLLDLAIIFQSIPAVILRRGAY